jgi:citrate lyase beta subunit
MRRRRALLYVPGDDPHKIGKSVGLGVDSIILDLEDGVALNHKEDARATVVKALRSLDFGPSEKLVRINSQSSGLALDDVDALVSTPLDGIVMPKAETAEAVRWAGQKLNEAEYARRLGQNALALILIIETARAFLNLKEMCAADPHIQALIFGGEDLAAELGATRTREATEMLYGRSQVVMHAAAFNYQAIDMVNTDFTDIDWLYKEAKQGADMGFSGKQVIHPNQVMPVQEGFTPNKDEVAHAQAIVDAFKQHQARGTGAFQIDGKMIDLPVVRRAENILARAGK